MRKLPLLSKGSERTVLAFLCDTAIELLFLDVL